MNTEPYCLFGCEDCGTRILLPFATLMTPLANPEAPSSDYPAVAVSCPECGHVAMHQVKQTGPLPDERSERLVWIRRDKDYGFVAPLGCGREDCEDQLAVFAPRSHPMTSEDKAADIATWRWDVLRCPNGHLIPKPQKK